MILVWDNGQDYSDHRIIFVDLGPEELADRRIGALCKHLKTHKPGGFIVGIADVIEWRKDLATWGEFTDHWGCNIRLHESDCELEPECMCGVAQWP